MNVFDNVNAGTGGSNQQGAFKPMGNNASRLGLGGMSKGCMGLGCVALALIVVLVGIVGWGISQYNGLVTQQQNVEKAWSQVESDYQRRADLIPTLVNTVKGYAKHEKETYEAVTTARASVGQVKIDAANLTQEQLQQYQQAQGTLGAALGKLIAVSEAYPELKANENFMALQQQLEGTENRINVSRKDFNNAAQQYNTQLKRFPVNIVAGMFGFQEKPYFKAAEGADKAPTVNFD